MTLIFYSAPWCQVCKSIRPMVEEVCDDENISFKYIDVEAMGVTEEIKDIVSLPTIKICDDKGYIMDCRQGKISQYDLVKMIRRNK